MDRRLNIHDGLDCLCEIGWGLPYVALGLMRTVSADVPCYTAQPDRRIEGSPAWRGQSLASPLQGLKHELADVSQWPYGLPQSPPQLALFPSPDYGTSPYSRYDGSADRGFQAPPDAGGHGHAPNVHYDSWHHRTRWPVHNAQDTQNLDTDIDEIPCRTYLRLQLVTALPQGQHHLKLKRRVSLPARLRISSLPVSAYLRTLLGTLEN